MTSEMTTGISDILDKAAAALAPSLRRGDRGRRVDRGSLGLGLAEGPLDRELQAAARERGLALFACTDSQRMVNVVSLAPPGERDWRRALEMLKTRPRSSSCSYCSLQSIVPAKGKSPLVPVAGTFHRLHPECLPGWRLWAAAAEKHLAARRPSQVPATAGLAAAVIRITPKLLGTGRGWRGAASILWREARACALGGAGAWVGDGFGAASFANVLHATDREVRDELAAAGLHAWRGADGLVRLARISDAAPSHKTRANQCSLCEIVEGDEGEPLEQLRGGARVHNRCEFARVVAQHSRRRAA